MILASMNGVLAFSGSPNLSSWAQISTWPSKVNVSLKYCHSRLLKWLHFNNKPSLDQKQGWQVHAGLQIIVYFFLKLLCGAEGTIIQHIDPIPRAASKERIYKNPIKSLGFCHHVITFQSSMREAGREEEREKCLIELARELDAQIFQSD